MTMAEPAENLDPRERLTHLADTYEDWPALIPLYNKTLNGGISKSQILKDMKAGLNLRRLYLNGRWMVRKADWLPYLESKVTSAVEPRNGR